MILGFLLTALYWPGIAGAATTPRWGLLAVVLPAMLLRRSADTKFTIVHLFGALFLTWSAISLCWTPNRLDGLGELVKLVILAQAFVLGSRLDSLRPLLIGLAAGLLLSSIFVLLQLQWPEIVYHTTAHSGLFINSGSLGEIAALVLIGLIYLNISHDPHPFLTVGILPCIILPQSRGSWLALLAAFMVWLWSKSRLAALGSVAAALIVFTYSVQIGFHAGSVTQRIGIWSDAIAGMNWLGHGLGSFWTDYAPLSNTLDILKERPEHLHNDWLEIVFEFGAIGTLLVIGLILSCGRSWNPNMDVAGYRLLSGIGGEEHRSKTIAFFIFAGFAAESLVGFPLHVPCTAFLGALCLGHLARGRADIRDVIACRRIRLCRWIEGTNDRREGRSPAKGRGSLSAGSTV